MSADKITDLDKRISIQEATLTKVLEAQERAANSTEQLNRSVIEMTSEFRYVRSEVERSQEIADKAFAQSKENQSEIKVIFSKIRWQDWAARTVIAAMVGGIIFAMSKM